VGQVAVAASPVCSNEDLLAGLAFARDALKVTKVYVTGRPSGAGDDFLMTADKNPNRRGLECIAKGLGLELAPFDALTRALDAGQVRALFALGADVPEDPATFAARTEKLELFVVTATTESPVTEKAHVTLAASTHVEDEGTFTQVGGLTQRFRRAYPPKGDSQPHWKWAVDLARALGLELAAASSREIFKKLAPVVPELASYEWDKQAPINQKRPGIGTLPSSADGRPPGWREQGVPNLRGLTLPHGT
jgi:NADH-quinone oxidoreductase subunit G